MKTVRDRLLVLATVVFFGVLAGPVLAQNDARSSVSGFVFGPDRRPVSQIWVEIRNDLNRVVGRMKTDGSGRFFFNNLTNGRYQLKALPLGTGLLDQTEDVELAGIGSRGQSLPDNQQKDIYLKARKSSSAVPFQNAVIYAQTVPKDAEDLYKIAIEDLDRQKVREGIAGLERATAIFPTYFLALQKLGFLHLMQNEFQKANDLFDRALAVNTRCFDCWYGIGYAKYSTGKFADSVAALDKALVEAPESVEANLLMGMACRTTKEYEKAEKALKLAIKASDQTSPDAHWQLALLYGRDTKRYSEAAKELESFLKLSPDAPNKDDIKKLIKQFKDQAANAE
ncbi:MAG: tetratricopeptide repeat protein [Pyrinomonadaceae bacterium]